jgi:hypothetical protein
MMLKRGGMSVVQVVGVPSHLPAADAIAVRVFAEASTFELQSSATLLQRTVDRVAGEACAQAKSACTGEPGRSSRCRRLRG